MKYYFRAECSCDSEKLANLLMDRKIRFRFIHDHTDNDYFEGMDVDCSIIELWKMMNEIEDGHVMADTVNTPENYIKYDGARRYGNPPGFELVEKCAFRKKIEHDCFSDFICQKTNQECTKECSVWPTEV